MITRMELTNWRSFQRGRLELGGTNLLLGDNATGKTALLDALRAVREIWAGEEIADALGHQRRGNSAEPTILTIEGNTPTPWRYSVRRPTADGMPYHETLVSPNNGTTVVTGNQRHKSIRTTLAREGFGTPEETALARSVSNAMRRVHDGGTRIKPTTLGRIAKALDEHERQAWDSWLREWSSERLDKVGTRTDSAGQHHATIAEHGTRVDVADLCAGDQELVALLNAMLKSERDATNLFDDIGAHAAPERLRVVAELLERRQVGNANTTYPQVIAATHQPLIADWKRTIESKHIFVCSHDSTGRTRVRPMSELQRFLRGNNPPGITELAAEGWLQTACEAADAQKEDENGAKNR